MRRHIIVLALAAGATGAGLYAHWLVPDAPPRRSGAVVGATEPIPAGRGAAAVQQNARPVEPAALRQAGRAYLDALESAGGGTP